MKTLNLKIQGAQGLKPHITVDGKTVHYKRNKFNNIEITHQTEKDSVEVSISNVLEILGPCWWLVQMAFFVISLFGILNPKLEKTFYEVNYKAKINLLEDENDILVKFLPTQETAMQCDSENVEVLTNECLISEKAKKRNKILKISKILSWLLLIVAILLIVIIR